MSKFNNRWDYAIRAYYPPNVQPPHTPNALAIETVHATEVSRDVEITAFRERMKRSEIGYIDVIDLISPYGIETIYAGS